MTCKLKHIDKTLKEWQELSKETQQQFKCKLAKRLQTPLVIKDKLQGEVEHYYKIKLCDVGYRLVYQVNESERILIVVTVGKCNRNLVYN